MNNIKRMLRTRTANRSSWKQDAVVDPRKLSVNVPFSCESTTFLERGANARRKSASRYLPLLPETVITYLCSTVKIN